MSFFQRLLLSCYILLLLSVSPAHAAFYTLYGDVIGFMQHYTVKEDDNLYAIARGHEIGIVELLAANPGTDVWEPEVGKKLTITNMHILPPGPREGIVINLSELRMFYYAPDNTVMSAPIGIGREGWRTPVGSTKILRKREHPTWTPPPSIREENPDLPASFPPGPDNPLGDYALDLGFYGILIHGTNRPYGIGKRSSHGCIRMYPEDIEVLFEQVEAGMPVTIIDTSYKLGWQGRTLYLEVTPTQEQSDVIAQYRQPVPDSIPEIYDAIRELAGEEVDIHWYEVDQAAGERTGIPVAIGERP